jgi:predicted HTH transcriptional regulator
MIASIYEISSNFIRVTFKFDVEKIEDLKSNLEKRIENDQENDQETIRENNQEYDQKATQKATQKRPENMHDKTKNAIISEIKLDSKITTKQLSKKLNFGITKIKSNISKLKESGVIKRVGPNKGGHWEVIGLNDNKDN